MINQKAGSVTFENVKKAFGAFTAIPDLSLTIEPGTLVTLLGPSGCGKTTTLRMLAGLEHPSAGRILIGGKDVTMLPANERDVSMVFQSYALFPHMNSLDNVAYGLESSGLSRREARERAEKRLERWRRVLSGMADGSLSIGSRTPVKGLPAWVTPEVVRGGFATGTAAASGPPLPHEEDAARRAGIAGDRRSLFLHYLTDAGLEELYALLDGGEYDVALPEEGALLTVAWLLRAGDRAGALEVLNAIGPFADRLRFSPRPGVPLGDASLVHRQTVGQVRERIEAKPMNKAVAVMNEALVVWNPFADELLLGLGTLLLANWKKRKEPGIPDKPPIDGEAHRQ